MLSEKTFVMIKPDGVKRQLVGEVIRRFEQRGFQLRAMRMLVPTEDLARRHYAALREQKFFPSLISFITSGPVVAMSWEGPGIVAAARAMLGPTDPLEAAPGTLRGDFASQIEANLVHASDAPTSAEHELALWF